MSKLYDMQKEEKQYKAKLMIIYIENKILPTLDKDSKDRKDMEEILKDAKKVAYGESEKLEDVGKWFVRG